MHLGLRPTYHAIVLNEEMLMKLDATDMLTTTKSSILCAMLCLAIFSQPAVGQDLVRDLNLRYESPLLIRKGSVEISLADFVAYMDRRVPAEDQRELLSSATRIERALENIALTEAFRMRAEEAGMMDDPYFRARLYQAAIREARDAYREKLQAEIELDSYEAQAREMFLVERERFTRAETVDMEHILVTVTDDQNQIEAMRQVINAYDRLVSGEEFVAVATELSDDPTFPDNQGLLEDIEVGALVPSVATAVQSLELNEYSFPIQSVFGWHIIRIKEKQEAGQMTWEEAKPLAEQMARNRHLTESFERVLREINAPPMEFEPGAVRAILDHYGVDGFGLPNLRAEEESGSPEQ